MKKLILFAAISLFAAQIPLFSQISLFSAAGKRSARPDTPTTINADAMDIDIANNKATFLGNVLVDDPEMLITCRKMILFLEDAEKTPKADGKKGDAAKAAAPGQNAPAAESDDPTGGKKLTRIECIDDVVITRKAPLSNGEEQKAFAGKAIYNVKDETITLLIKPLVIKGKSRVRGEVITLHLDSERVEVVNATIHSTEIGK